MDTGDVVWIKAKVDKPPTASRPDKVTCWIRMPGGFPRLVIVDVEDIRGERGGTVET